MEMLETVVTPPRKYGSKVAWFPFGLTAEEGFRGTPDLVNPDFGHVDLLLHCAGTITLGRMESAPLEAFDRRYRTNVRAPFALAQGLLPMLKTRRGQVGYIGSRSGEKSMPSRGRYSGHPTTHKTAS